VTRAERAPPYTGPDPQVDFREDDGNVADEATLLIVKPDGVRRGLVGEVLRRVEAKGLRIAELKLMSIDRGLAEEHYDEHTEKPFFGELVEFITSGPVVVARVEGDQAVPVLRALMGPTNPVDALPGTLRGDFCTVITQNLVHGSDSVTSAERELKLFFGSV
jgi:nucleoside-diphosphate kinase